MESLCDQCRSALFKCLVCNKFELCETCKLSYVRGHRRICRPVFSDTVRAYAEILSRLNYATLSYPYDEYPQGCHESYHLSHIRGCVCAVCGKTSGSVNRDTINITPGLRYSRCNLCVELGRILCPNTYGDHQICINNIKSATYQYACTWQFITYNRIPADILRYIAQMIIVANHLCVNHFI